MVSFRRPEENGKNRKKPEDFGTVIREFSVICPPLSLFVPCQADRGAVNRGKCSEFLLLARGMTVRSDLTKFRIDKPGQAFRVSTDLKPARQAAHSWYRILGAPGFGFGLDLTRTSGLPHSGQARTG